MPHRVLIEVFNRLAFLGEIRDRRMFGGHGLYLDETFFGLIDGQDSQLYLRTDATMAAAREAAGSWLFEPMEGKGTMNYAAVPHNILHDSQALAIWCERALRIARLKKEAEGCGLVAMRNISKDTAFFLLDAGIQSPEALRKLGPTAAFLAIQKLGHEVPEKLLWVLDGALRDQAWYRLSDERKAELASCLQ